MPKIAKLGKNAQQILETKRDELFKEIKKYLNINDSKTYIIGWINFLILFETIQKYIKENPNELTFQETDFLKDTNPEDLMDIVMLAFYDYLELIEAMYVYDFEEEWQIDPDKLGDMSIKELEEFKSKVKEELKNEKS